MKCVPTCCSVGVRVPRPQQYAEPSARSPHVRWGPAESAAKWKPPATGTGWVLHAVSPVPSIPLEFEPQQYAVLSVARPQVWSISMAIVVNA